MTHGQTGMTAHLRRGRSRSIKIGKLRRITDTQLAEFMAALESADREALGARN